MKMKKYLKTIIVFFILALLVLCYYFYLSNRPPRRDSTDLAVDNQELAKLTTYNIETNYPQSPREVVKLYARITQAYYKTDLTDEQIEKLGKQARLLFDKMLLRTQSDEEFLAALRKDIEYYDKQGRYISDYEIADISRVEYKTLQGQEYAIVPMKYYIRQGGEFTPVYHSFKLHKDEKGRWKILYWEITQSTDLKQK